jgi:hypothetical protein
MASMTAAALPYALSGYDVILDFSIPPWFLPTAFKMTNRREVPLDYVVLMPGESECASRAAARTEGQITDYSRYHDLYLSFNEAGQYSIQNDSIGASDAANMIREDLKKGRFRILQ